MADTLKGQLGPIILDGYFFGKAVESTRDIVWTPTTEVVRLEPSGRTREASRYQGAGWPLEGGHYEVTLDYQHIRGMYDLVLDLMAAPGIHQLVFWRRHVLAYSGNGARAEFFLPWPPAIVPLGPWNLPPTLSGATPAAGLATEVKTGIGGVDANGVAQTSTSFTVSSKDETGYAGTPAASEAWFLADGTKFKVGTAPGVGERLYCRIVPIVPVLRQGRVESKYAGASQKEPRNIVLMEI